MTSSQAKKLRAKHNISLAEIAGAISLILGRTISRQSIWSYENKRFAWDSNVLAAFPAAVDSIVKARAVVPKNLAAFK